ncbi:hypothetical protein FRC06_000253 [Ceratobasidium sp. 370]|nr:hypothetical protein FRC06_000253 [Ceratobasidium sp. 370]
MDRSATIRNRFISSWGSGVTSGATSGPGIPIDTLKLLNYPRTVLSKAEIDNFMISSASGSLTLTSITVKYVPSKAVTLNKESTFTVLASCQSVKTTHDLAGVCDFTLSSEGAYSFSPANVFNYVDTKWRTQDDRTERECPHFQACGKARD